MLLEQRLARQLLEQQSNYNNKGAKEMAVEIKHIIKRDGSVKDFDVHKIVYAIECVRQGNQIQFGRERAQEINQTRS